MSVNAIGNVVSPEGNYTLFEIDSPSQPLLYMRLDHQRLVSGQRSVVVLEANRFRHVWRHIRNGESPTKWMSSPQMAKLSVRFNQGTEAPLSLPIVRVKQQQSLPPFRRFLLLMLAFFKRAKLPEPEQIEIIEGRHRIQWLIANRVNRFPVECQVDDVNGLLQLAGDPEAGPLSAASLQSLPVAADQLARLARS